MESNLESRATMVISLLFIYSNILNKKVIIILSVFFNELINNIKSLNTNLYTYRNWLAINKYR